MSSVQESSDHAAEMPSTGVVDMKLEAVVIPVSDVDRAKEFYGGLDWRLDADVAAGDAFRIVQFTPPGSATAFGSAGDLAQALRRAAAAHGEHEKRTGEADENWPDWYAEYMVREQAGEELPT